MATTSQSTRSTSRGVARSGDFGEPLYKDLKHVADVDAEPVRWRDAVEERAAIMEFDAGLPRAEAETAASADVLGLWRLENTRRPATAFSEILSAAGGRYA